MWDMIELSTGNARADQALAMLNNRTDTSGIDEANAILDELCLDRRAAERLIRACSGVSESGDSQGFMDGRIF
jgi:hypothetical protein